MEINKELEKELSKATEKLTQIVKKYDNGSLENFWLGYKLGVEKTINLLNEIENKEKVLTKTPNLLA